MNTHKNILVIAVSTVFLAMVLLFISVFAPVFAPELRAQIPTAGVAGVTLTLDVNPDVPGPNQLVTVTAESFSIDLNRANIRWFVNNTLLIRGTGRKEMTFQVGAIGSRSTVEIIASVAGGGTFSAQVVIRPSEVDMIWEAFSYTPSFYKGKAMPAADTEVTIVALPNFIDQNGRRLRPETLIYTWKKGGRVLGSLSGFGKNTLTISGPHIFGSSVVSVDVASLNQQIQGRGTVIISTTQPKIIFYEDGPLFGMRYENAVSETFALLDEEVKIVAHPYFFAVERRDHFNLEYEWNIDGQIVENPSVDRSSITLRQISSGEGTSIIALKIQNLKKILQGAQKSFLIEFGINNSGLLPSFF